MAVKVVDAKTGKEKIVCGAHLSTGAICMRSPIRGRTRCKYHGGRTPRGENHRSFITGKYSKDLRRDILQDYFTALASGDLLTQSSEIALYDARIAMLLRQASMSRETTEMVVCLKQIQETLEQAVITAEGEREKEVHLDRVMLRSIGQTVGTLIDDLVNERRKWEEVYQVIDNRRKLIESERRAIIDSQRMMTEQQALVLVAALVNIIRKYVIDADVRNAISAEFVQLSGYQNRPELTGESVSPSAYGL